MLTSTLPPPSLADLHADHDPLSPLSVLADGLIAVPARSALLVLSDADRADTRGALVATLLSLDTWGTGPATPDAWRVTHGPGWSVSLTAPLGSPRALAILLNRPA